ncbi:glycosyltransferase [Patescibacteria group bacterium]|nr:glycosyltransferase [Patescibacteria group bacterium]
MTLKKPVISVIIAAYNEENYLPSCLACLTQQTYPQKFEVIVVNNNSTDRTISLAKKWGAKIVHEKKQGIGPAKAAGVKMAQGQYLVFLDADIHVPPWWLSKIEKNLSRPKIVATGGPYAYQTKKPFLRLLPHLHYLGLKIFGGIPGGNMAFKKEAFEAVGGFDTEVSFGEDLCLSMKIKKQGKIFVDPKLKVVESGRRYDQQGVFKTILEYIPSTLGVIFKNKRLLEKGDLKPFR